MVSLPRPYKNTHSMKEIFVSMNYVGLVVWSKTKNATSFFIANSLKLLYRKLGEPFAVVSYADSEYGHAGIIYQATNWIYTGATKSHDKAYIIDGKRIHPMTLRDRGITNPTTWAKENNIEMVKPEPKHRYFIFVGDKRSKKKMLHKLKYPIVNEYPKCVQKRYDTGPDIYISVPEIENVLFP